MITIKQIKSLTILLCCFIISSISTTSFAQQVASQAIGQWQRQSVGSINTSNQRFDNCFGYSCGYQNFTNPRYFQRLRVPYISPYNSYTNNYPAHYGYYTGLSFSHLLALRILKQSYTQPNQYQDIYRHRRNVLNCQNGSYKAYVNGQWICHKNLVCQDNEYKVYVNGEFICRPRQVACTQEIRFCPDGSRMPREADCTWRPDQCTGTQNPDCITNGTTDCQPTQPTQPNPTPPADNPQGCSGVLCTLGVPVCTGNTRLVNITPNACCPTWRCEPRRRNRGRRGIRGGSVNINQIQNANAAQNLNQLFAR